MDDPATVPTVSVVIPTHNYAQYLAQAIDSVLGQSRPPFEVIVVDDGSTDATPDVVSAYGGHVRYLRVEHHKANPTRNAGIRAARGDYVALLDADDVWLPQKLELQVARVRSAPGAGLVYGHAVAFESGTGAVLGIIPRNTAPEGWVLRELYQTQFVPSPTPLIRRDVFDEVGLFDESAVGSDDWDMWLRIAYRFPFAAVPDVVAKYRVHSSAGTERPYAHVRRDQLRLVRAAAERYPELRPLRRRREHHLNKTFGWQMWRQGDNVSARECFTAALRDIPSPSAAIGWAASWLPGDRRRDAIDRAYGAYFNGKHSLARGERWRALGEFATAIRTAPLADGTFYCGLAATLLPARLSRGRLGPLAREIQTQRPSERIQLRQW